MPHAYTYMHGTSHLVVLLKQMGKFNTVLSVVLILTQTSICMGSEGDELIFNVTCSTENCQGQSESCSLEAVAVEIKEHSHVNVDIVIPAIWLKSNISFANLSSLTIAGKSRQMTTITCKANAGILFTDISDMISLINLKMLSCGSPISIKSSDRGMITYVSALSMIRCRNVKLYELDIHGSRGLGLTILDHQEGRVNITSATFKYNELPQHFTTANDFTVGGGGVYLELSHFHTDQNPMAFTFDNCTFEKNTADTKNYDYLYTDAVGVPHEGAGRGGGMNLILGPSIKNINISFIQCKFLCNQAFHGSGLAVKLLGKENKKSENIKIEIVDSTFEQNGKNSYGFGAGLYLTFYDSSPYGDTVVDCHTILMNVRFMKNHAEYGGGLFFFSSKQRFPNSNSLLFTNCTFMENVAYLGSGVLFPPDMYFSLSAGYSVTPVFKDCQFLTNKVRNPNYHNHQNTPGLGTVYVSERKIQFQGYNSFENNSGCGIYLVNGVMDFQNSSMLFINNTGFNGGAVTLIGSSTMIVGHNNYEFINNTAVYRGGAIYVSLFDKTDFTTSRRCFIQYINDDMKVLTHRWNLTLTFTGNRAKDGTAGHAIFATSFLPCQIIDSTILQISEIFHNRSEYITFDDNVAIEDQLSTDGAVLKGKASQWLTIIPGIEYQLGVTLSNDFNNTVQVPFRATLEKQVGKALLNQAKSQYVGSEIELQGNPGSEAKLILYTASRRDSYIEFNVSLTNCPPGFMLTKDLGCVCNTAAYVGLLRCDTNHSYLLPGYWAGILNTTSGRKLVTSAYPFHAHYSSQKFEIMLPETFSETEINRLVCGETRTGIGCGRCQENLTAYFHSPDFACGPLEPFDCKLGWIFYILSELTPITLIFISVLLLNISFTSGAVNGFILFSQLLLSFDTDASGVIQFPEHARAKIEDATHVYKLIYGFLNLCMFNAKYFSFCLWKGASTLDLLALKYVSIVYALLLITTVILIMNKCGGRCLGKYCRITVIKVSIIHGISTFLILCYTQCIRVSINILIPLHIHVPANDTNFTCTSCTKVWLNGDLRYFHKEHLPYALPALFCLLTVGLLPPVLLISYPLINKLSLILGLEDQMIVTGISCTINYLKPLLDSFQGCFKDNLRFFAGLYFLYRWSYHLIYFVTSYDEYYTIIGCTLLFIFTMHTICQPYIKTAHNVIDALLFADLILINSLSYFSFQKVSSQKAQYGTTVTPAIVQLVLIYLPLLIMFTYLLATFCMWIVKQGIKSQNFTKGNVIAKKTLKMRALLQGISSQGESTETSEEELLHDRVEYHEW